MSKMPLIGVTPLVDYKLHSLWMIPGYMDAITRAGGIPVMLPLHLDSAQLEGLLDQLDGIVFTGGPDISPEVLAQYAGTSTSSIDSNDSSTALVNGQAQQLHTDEAAVGRSEVLSPERDALEMALFQSGLARDISMLGICRGMQLMNVACGGTLWHDLPTEHPSDVEHHMHDVPEDALGHDVTIVPNTPLFEQTQLEHMPVNSYHHQAVRTLGEGFELMAVADDGIVEAMWRPGNRCVWAVQWHPELLIARGPNIIDYFVETITSF
ncbi:amidotransferase [Galliscardovia ingluviei]|uniref:Amidotransferase n=1 Tax=Galliscardovia ingluviei TaxID=1769422 RepID=A0A8J3AI79_9BIFI|nr:gamma-glutamyl-gamma-aminobutyrate hydrolase family protein [Galliscardovia ingluviei]GGI13868.1 amidotransferase [Galliscardovia ingluviei]